MKQEKNQAKSLHLNKSTIARLSDPSKNAFFLTELTSVIVLCSTRPQCDTVKPLTA